LAVTGTPLRVYGDDLRTFALSAGQPKQDMALDADVVTPELLMPMPLDVGASPDATVWRPCGVVTSDVAIHRVSGGADVGTLRSTSSMS
jgi:hypothetical protein